MQLELDARLRDLNNFIVNGNKSRIRCQISANTRLYYLSKLLHFHKRMTWYRYCFITQCYTWLLNVYSSVSFISCLFMTFPRRKSSHQAYRERERESEKGRREREGGQGESPSCNSEQYGDEGKETLDARVVKKFWEGYSRSFQRAQRWKTRSTRFLREEQKESRELRYIFLRCSVHTNWGIFHFYFARNFREKRRAVQKLLLRIVASVWWSQINQIKKRERYR